MWKFDGSIATADLGELALIIGLAADDRKVLVNTSGDLLLATLWDMPAVSGQPLLDAYVRDDDLVCVAGPSDTFPFTTQLYWTLRTIETVSAPLAALSLLVSVRTDQLDTHPEVEVVSQAPCRSTGSFDVAGGPAYLVPLRENVSLVDFATPEDCVNQKASESSDGNVAIERTLFGHFLEKGVIRSGRLFAALLSGEPTQRQAGELCMELLASELPLTT